MPDAEIARLRTPAAGFAQDDILPGLVGRARHHVISEFGIRNSECRAFNDKSRTWAAGNSKFRIQNSEFAPDCARVPGGLV